MIFSPINMFVVLDIDECSASSPVCDINANCSNTRGSYICTCRAGYTGDGKTCQGKSRFSVITTKMADSQGLVWRPVKIGNPSNPVRLYTGSSWHHASGYTSVMKLFWIAWENSRYLTTLPLVSPPNNVWGTSADIRYWSRVPAQIWVVLMIGYAAWEIWCN